MNPTFDAFLRSWPFDPMLLAVLALTGGIYLRGWLALRWHAGRLCAFLGGLTVIYLALASPIEPFASLLLQVHMLQHMLLMMASPPLLWLGAPMFPLLRGLPRSVRSYWAAPLVRSPAIRQVLARLTHPAVALPIFAVTTWIWHAPAAYELALNSSGWHYLQHVCFLAAGMLFWYPVVRPFPSRPRWSPWLLLPYLILADVQSTVLAALLTFSDRALYPYYLQVPRLGGLSVLEDQAAAGVIMWVPGSLVFLLPLFGIGVGLLYGTQDDRVTGRQGDKVTGRQGDKVTGRQGDKVTGRQGDKVTGRQGDRVIGRVSPGARVALPLVSSSQSPITLSPCHPVTLSPCHPVTLSSFDLLRLPLLGRFLKWRHARLAMQLPLLALAGVVIIDGLCGPQVGPMNLAGVLPWIHWRGLLILGLLAAGNVFCMACPFMLPRTVARRWLPQGRTWPRWLRSKWLAVALLVLFLWSYEAFSLWDSPWWTAWIVVGYFASALVIDGFFRGAAFCKYVCPLGQFNFVQSLISPLEIKVRDPKVCTSCRTKDCIRGREREEGEDGRRRKRETRIPRVVIPGCELHLFQPIKKGNMDCTFCLDCIHACPHDNIGIPAGMPGKNLWHSKDDKVTRRQGDRVTTGRDSSGARISLPLVTPVTLSPCHPVTRSSIDLAVLMVVLVFGAFANAAGMVGPVVAWQQQLGSSPLLRTSLFYLIALLVLPVLLVGGAAEISRRWGKLTAGWVQVATRYSYSLVPVGFAMWLAHYSFHFLTSCETVVPTTQRFAAEHGWTGLGEPNWDASCCGPVTDWLPRLEILFLDLGLLLSLYTAYRIALVQSPRLSTALKAWAPWALLIFLLFAVGVWLVLQPMQMRGTLGG